MTGQEPLFLSPDERGWAVRTCEPEVVLVCG